MASMIECSGLIELSIADSLDDPELRIVGTCSDHLTAERKADLHARRPLFFLANQSGREPSRMCIRYLGPPHAVPHCLRSGSARQLRTGI